MAEEQLTNKMVYMRFILKIDLLCKSCNDCVG